MGLAERALITFDGVDTHALDATRRLPVTDWQESDRCIRNGVVLSVPAHQCHRFNT